MTFQTQENSADFTDIVTVAEVKEYIRVDGSDQDVIIPILIESATRLSEAYTQQSFGNKTFTVEYFDLKQHNRVTLPFGYHRSVTSVNRVDSDGSETLLSEGTDYLKTGLNEFMITILTRTFSSSNALLPSYKIEYEAGPAVPATVNKLVKGAVLKTLSDFYENRENSSDMSITKLPQSAALMLTNLRLR